MTPPSACAAVILRWANEAYDRAKHERDRAVCDEAARKAAEAAWDTENPMDGVGGLSANPYTRCNTERIERRKNEFELATAVRDFAINRVCAEIH